MSHATVKQHVQGNSISSTACLQHGYVYVQLVLKNKRRGKRSRRPYHMWTPNESGFQERILIFVALQMVSATKNPPVASRLNTNYRLEIGSRMSSNRGENFLPDFGSLVSFD